MNCAVDECESDATIRLHVPWSDDEVVCTDHARGRVQQDGIVAEPLETTDSQLPEGAANRDE